jgi:DNA-binding response OmpR family regulator
MTARILLIEGKPGDHASFAPALTKKGFQVETVPNGNAALARLVDLDPDLVVVDAASLRTSGRRICQSLHRENDALPIVLILPKASSLVENNDAIVVLILPFTVQKLVNRFRPFMRTDEKDLLHVGPIRLNMKQRQVSCLDRQSRLTPHLVTLLKLLMEHPGEVMERATLFRLAWNTEYTVDTRTLDVHVSWLRRAIETDPRHPRFLKTVRGIGYRLDI